MPALRIYSEMLPYADVVRPRTLDLLARYGLEIVLAVRPWDLDALPGVAKELAGAGVPLSVWPMLSDEEGRWANARNAASFAAFAARTVDVLEDAGRPPRELLFDLEPSFNETRMLLAGVSRGGAALRPVSRSALEEAERVLVSTADALHARGVATSSAVWPLVALDEPDSRAWQSLLGTPVDALATGRVSVMLYTSIFEGWSRGAVGRRHAAALLWAASRRTAERYGERASVSLGCVGTGAFHDEPIFRSPAELAEDVALARAAGCEDLSLFDLAGVLAREPAEAWLDAFTHQEVSAPPPSRRVALARTALRAATSVLRRWR